MAGKIVLELKNITVRYGKSLALKGISLTVEEGSIVTLIGANGAGKTTTLNAISGVKRVSSGEIWYCGQRIDRWRPQRIVKAGISQVPEGRRIFPRMTVLENLKVGACLRRDGDGFRQDLTEIWRRFPVLKERQSQQAGSLSGGEQQMLAIGRALVARPKLILFDEPTMGLAPLMVRETARAITAISQTGVTVVLVEQNARLALKLADKACVLETGKIALEGPAYGLIENPYLKTAYLGG